jgi:hypothetical protein
MSKSTQTAPTAPAKSETEPAGWVDLALHHIPHEHESVSDEERVFLKKLKRARLPDEDGDQVHDIKARELHKLRELSERTGVLRGFGGGAISVHPVKK